MIEKKVMIALLILVALLLAANLMVNLGFVTTPAHANIVEGKNIFSTTAPDGQTVYLWGYQTSGTLGDQQVQAEYYGSISTSGKFVKN